MRKGVGFSGLELGGFGLFNFKFPVLLFEFSGAGPRASGFNSGLGRRTIGAFAGASVDVDVMIILHALDLTLRRDVKVSEV